MNTQQLEYVLAVAEELSFTRAAKRFFVSQAAISSQIKAVETELGVQLFERDRHHVALTSAGYLFVQYARDMLIRNDDIKRRLRAMDEPSEGSLRLGYVQGYEHTDLPKMISAFHKRYPRVRISLMRGDVGSLYDALRSEKLDVVINIKYPNVDVSGVEFQVLRHYPLVAVLPYEHPLAQRSVITPQDLRGTPMIRYSVGSKEYGEDSRISWVHSHLQAYQTVNCTFNDLEASVLCVLAGFGFSLLPGYYANTLSSDSRAVAIPIEGMEREITIAAAWLPTTENDFIDVFLDEFLDVEEEG